MKLTKRILAAVLACIMALCLLTACGSSGNGVDPNAQDIIDELAENGITGVTTSTSFTAAAKEFNKAVEAADAAFAQAAKEAFAKTDATEQETALNNAKATWRTAIEEATEKLEEAVNDGFLVDYEYFYYDDDAPIEDAKEDAIAYLKGEFASSDTYTLKEVATQLNTYTWYDENEEEIYTSKCLMIVYTYTENS